MLYEIFWGMISAFIVKLDILRLLVVIGKLEH